MGARGQATPISAQRSHTWLLGRDAGRAAWVTTRGHVAPRRARLWPFSTRRLCTTPISCGAAMAVRATRWLNSAWSTSGARVHFAAWSAIACRRLWARTCPWGHHGAGRCAVRTAHCSARVGPACASVARGLLPPPVPWRWLGDALASQPPWCRPVCSTLSLVGHCSATRTVVLPRDSRASSPRRAWRMRGELHCTLGGPDEVSADSQSGVHL